MSVFLFTVSITFSFPSSMCPEKSVVSPSLLSSATSLRDHAAFFQSETMRPANDPKERDPSHVRMLNDVLRDLEKSFIIPQTPPGVYRYETSCTLTGVALVKCGSKWYVHCQPPPHSQSHTQNCKQKNYSGQWWP